MIEIKKVSKVYSSKAKTTTRALDNVSFTLPDKGMFFILGKSGCGKSTLLNLMGGLDNVTSGNIIVDDKDITKLSDKEYDAYRNSIIGIVFQEFNLLDEYNVFDNIALAVELQNKVVNEKDVLALLEKLGLKGLENRKINELSGGQKQRVAIARALIKEPRILLCDEPTGNLDSKSSRQIFDILKSISEDILVVVVSHDVEAANSYSDGIVHLVDGKVDKNVKISEKKSQHKLNLIPSKLPLKYVKKIAQGSMFAKPIKLFMTVLITSLAILFMGIGVDIVLFDEKQLVYETMVQNDIYSFTFKRYTKRGTMFGDGVLQDKHMKRITENIGDNKLNYVYYVYVDNDLEPFKFNFDDDTLEEPMYDSGGINYYFDPRIDVINFVEVKDDSLFNNLIGKMPKNSSEIVVHKYFAEYVMEFGIYDNDNNLYKPSSIDELIESKRLLSIGEYEVYITGVIDDDNSKYEKAYKNGIFEDEKLYLSFLELYADFGNWVYVNGFIENYEGSNNQENVVKRMQLAVGSDDTRELNLLQGEVSVVTSEGEKTISTLAKDEVIISYEMFKRADLHFNTKFDEYAKDYIHLPLVTIQKNYVMKYLAEHEYGGSISLYNNVDKYNGNVKVVGVSFDGNNYVSYDFTLDYVPHDISKETFLVHEDEKKELKRIIDSFDVYDKSAKDGEYLVLEPILAWEIYEISDLHYYLGYIALVVTLVFTLFTIFVFTNFISVSISYSRKKIGILKALGASSRDVLKIFAYESSMISITSWFVGLILILIGNEWINNMFKQEFFAHVDVITHHPFSPVIMLLHTLIISIFITAIAISYVTKVKPIDSILEK